MRFQQSLDSLLQQILTTSWNNIFNTDDRKDSLILRPNSAIAYSLTRNLGLGGNEDPPWLSEPMIPFYFAAGGLRTTLQAILEGCPAPDPIPFVLYTGIGDNCNAMGNVQDESLRFILLPTDVQYSDSRDLEVQWLSHGRLQYRFRRADWPKSLEAQLPTNYWGGARYSHSEELGIIGSPAVKVIKVCVDFHVEDEAGVGSSALVSYIVGQLANGVVLWWENLYENDQPFKLELTGEQVRIENDGKVRDFNVTNHFTPRC